MTRRSTKTPDAATVSGPGLDVAVPEGPAVGLSRAITAATASPGPVTFYVREADGSPYGRVERIDEGGMIHVFGPAQLAAERRAAETTRPADRAGALGTPTPSRKDDQLAAFIPGT